MKKTVRFMTSVAAVAVATAAIPFSAEASSNFEMRKKVATLSGIVTSKDTNQYITRGEFARMLVNASSYKESASATTPWQFLTMFRHPTNMPLIFASRPIMAG